MAEPLTYSLADAAERIGCSRRYLEDECRAGRIEYCEFGIGRRRLTESQIQLVVQARTKKPRPLQHYIPAGKRIGAA